MKLFADLFPVILFFGAFYLAKDLFIATAVAMAATCVQVALAWLKHRRVEPMQWLSLGLMIVLGGATLLLKDKNFIMWKPTALYWLMSGSLAAAHWGFKKQPLKHLLGTALTLPDALWSRLTAAWVLFFLALGGLNLFVAWHFSEAVWVNFKLFGVLALMLIFLIVQGLVLSKYLSPDDKT